MSHMSELSIGIDETIAAMLATQANKHAAIAAQPGPRSVVHAELAHRYATLSRRVAASAIDWTDETVQAVPTT